MYVCNDVSANGRSWLYDCRHDCRNQRLQKQVLSLGSQHPSRDEETPLELHTINWAGRDHITWCWECLLQCYYRRLVMWGIFWHVFAFQGARTPGRKRSHHVMDCLPLMKCNEFRSRKFCSSQFQDNEVVDGSLFSLRVWGLPCVEQLVKSHDTPTAIIGWLNEHADLNVSCRWVLIFLGNGMSRSTDKKVPRRYLSFAWTCPPLD